MKSAVRAIRVGKRLVSQVSGPVQLQALPGGVKAERRHLTILFCDMVGSSALSAELDPEDLRRILLAFQACCGEAIRDFGGHIARYLGDGILAYFGFPIAHEDDAERAVQAALQAVRSVSALSFPNVPSLKVRIGIATGLVVVGDLIGEGPSREFALIGEAPNLASRLQQLAQPNQILVSSATRRLLGQLFEFEFLGEQALKGFSESERVWSVLRPSGVASRFEAYRAARLTAFIGREAELGRLHACYAKAKEGEGQFVAIAGEPGIGKSRLIKSFQYQLPHKTYLSLLFQCSSYHTSSPWYPVIRHLEDALGIGYDATPALKLAKIEALVDDLLPAKRAALVPLLAALLGVPIGNEIPVLELTPQQQKRRTFSAMLELLHAQSKRQPVILICEDMHWIDPTSAELLDQLRQSLSSRRILVVVSFRPEVGVKPRANAAINLDRLLPGQAASMVESLVGKRQIAGPVVEQIISKTDGIPLFIEEVTYTILADPEAGKDKVPHGAVADTTVPETLHNSLMARLDQLPSAKTVAQTSAAIGREFSFNLLAAVTDLPQDEVRRSVDRLRQVGLIYRREQGPGEIYAFKHALVQDAAYASMLRDERRPLHRRIAQALETKFSEIAESAPEIIAFHYTQGGEVTAAIHAWLKAGRQASTRSAFVEAITHLETAMGLLGELPENRSRAELELQLQQALANACIAAKGFGADETTRAFNRALALCNELSDSASMVFVLNGLIGVHFMRGEFEKAHTLALDLLALARQKNEPLALLMGHRLLGMTLFVRGDLRAAKRELEAALTHYDPAQHASLALTLSQDQKVTAQAYLGLAEVLLGNREEGLTHSREALDYAQQLRHLHSICYILPFVAGTRLLAKEPQAAYEAAERAIALSEEYGFPQWVAGGLMLRGWIRIERGDVAHSLADIRESIVGLEATGTLIWIPFARYLLARALAESGELAPALELVDTILAEIATAGTRWYAAAVHLLKGDILRGLGRNPEEARSCYQAALALAQSQGARLWERAAQEALAAQAVPYRSDGRPPEPRPAAPPVGSARPAGGSLPQS